MENMNTYKLHQTGPETQTILDQVSTNTADIAQLRALYEALTQSGLVIIQPTDTWPVVDPEENVIYRVIDRVNTPPESYSDYMWNGTAMVLMATYDNAIDPAPTAGSNNPVASDGVLNYVSTNGSAYDISAANSGTAYADLAAALGTYGENVPEAVRKGGMSIRFVSSSDNKYVQWRYMGTSIAAADFTNVANWQGADDEPIAGSDNLVKSNGVWKTSPSHLFVQGTIRTSNIEKAESLITSVSIRNRQVNKNYKLKSFQYNTQYSGENKLFGQLDIENIDGTVASTIYFNKISYSWETDIVEVYNGVNNGIVIYLNKTSQYWGATTFNSGTINGILMLPNALEQKEFNDSVNALQSNIDREHRLSEASDSGLVQEIESENLVNPSRLLPNYYIQSDGTLRAATGAGYYVSDYIKVNGHNIISNGLTTPGSTYAVYDINGNILRGVVGTQYTYTDGDYYVRIAFYQPSNPHFYANYGTTLTNKDFVGLVDVVERNSGDIAEITFDENIAFGDKKSEIGKSSFTNSGVLRNGIFLDPSVSAGYGDYRVTDYIEVSSYDVVRFVHLMNISSFDAMAFYSEQTESSYIGRVAGQLDDGIVNIHSYTNAVYVRLCIYKTMEPEVSFYALDYTKIPNLIDLYNYVHSLYPITKLTKIITVDINGNGDYTNLDDALDNTNDSASSPTTILIFPGRYEMKTWDSSYVGVKANRYVNIIGVNKNQCVLYNTKGAYNYNSGTDYVDNACLKLAGNCLIANLTIESTDSDFDEQVYGANWDRSYCIHLDADSDVAGNTIEVRNCILKNDHFSCVGCGMRSNYTVRVVDCELYYNAHYPSWDFAAAIYVHDKANLVNETLIVENCKIQATGAAGIYVDCSIGNTQIDCEFAFNRVISTKDTFMYSGDAVKNDFCYGNNNSLMNN